jgi:hypothetical protein
MTEASGADKRCYICGRRFGEGEVPAELRLTGFKAQEVGEPGKVWLAHQGCADRAWSVYDPRFANRNAKPS